MTPKTKGEETQWCEVSLQGTDRLLIGCVYRSPNSVSNNNDLLIKDLKTVCNLDSCFSHILICGDFNLPGIKWNDNNACDGTTEQSFLEAFRDCFLHQHVREPTHHRGAQTANILDLVLTNEEHMIDNVEQHAPLGKSHHSVITFKMRCYRESEKPHTPQIYL